MKTYEAVEEGARKYLKKMLAPKVQIPLICHPYCIYYSLDLASLQFTNLVISNKNSSILSQM
jgi:hypothetical protein